MPPEAMVPVISVPNLMQIPELLRQAWEERGCGR